MKRVSQDVHFKLPPSTVYVDDLEALVELLCAADPKGKVEISLPGYSLESAAELIELGAKSPSGKVKEISLRGGRLYVSLDSFSSRVAVYEDTDANLGIASKVRDFFRARRKLLSPLRALFLFGAAAAAVWFVPTTTSEHGYLKAAAGISFTCLQLWAMVMEWPPHCRIHPVRRADRPSFLARHGAQLAIGLLGAVIGALAKKVFDLLF